MPLPSPDQVGWAPAQVTNDPFTAQPPQHVLDQIGGSYDQSRYYWNPDTFSLVDRYTGGSYSYDRADPANGTDVVTNYGNANQQTQHFGAGEQPFIGFGDGQPTFISADPQAIDEWQHDSRTRALQGVAAVGGLVGGAALGGALSGSNGVTAATQNYTAPTAVSSAAQTAGAAPNLAGMIPAVGSAVAPAAGAGLLPKIGNFLSKYGDYVIPAANGLLGAYASGQAADAEVGAMDRALAENARQYDTTRNDLMPWLTAGQGALTKLNDPAASFQASPGYEWARNEGQRDIGNSFAARGGAASGNALRALSEFNTGLAQQDFGNWWNQQAGLAGVGQTTGAQLGQIGANSAANAGNYFANQGASRASGVLGKYGAIGNAINDSYYNRLYRRGG